MQLVDHIPGGGDHLPAGQLLQRAYIDIGKEVGRVEFGHQHERAAQGNRPARHADSDAAAVLPAQRQREQPEHGLIRAHERGHGAQHTQPRPRGAAFVPPRQNAAAQHRQHERIVQRLLHGGEHIADRRSWRPAPAANTAGASSSAARPRRKTSSPAARTAGCTTKTHSARAKAAPAARRRKKPPGPRRRRCRLRRATR